MPKEDKKISLDPMEWRDAMRDVGGKKPAPGKKKPPAKKKPKK
jgi:hypothetical protein